MNWGYRLLFTFLAFGAMMGYLVIRSFGTTYELADKDYYNSELAYQKVIDGTHRANTLSSACQLHQNAAGVSLQFPKEMAGKNVTGSLWFYCDYNQQKDLRIPVQTDNNAMQLIPKSMISSGRYLVKITWDCDGKSYYSEQKLQLN